MTRHKEENNLPNATARQAVQAYYASISFVDAQVGRLLAALDDQWLRDATGRIVRAGKRGSIPAHLLPILERLQIDVDTRSGSSWVDAMCSTGRQIGTAIGSAVARAAEAVLRGVKWIADRARIHRPPQAAEST